MKTDQQIIFELLDTIEAVIYTNDSYRDVLSTEDLEDYCICALLAKKRYGRKNNQVFKVVCDLEGLSIGVLSAAGLSYEDIRV